MKNTIAPLLISLFLLSGCATQKKVETIVPFTLGEVYAQKWIVEDEPNDIGYEVIIPIVSLDNDRAVLQSLYHKGQIVDLEIELREIGTIAVAEFELGDQQKKDIIMHGDPRKEVGNIPPALDKNSFPFQLTETQAVISYLQKNKLRYMKIDGIRQNPIISYPNSLVKNER